MARQSAVVGRIAAARQQAQGGVDYSPKNGARCPWCDQRAKIYKTTPWEDNVRVRYHRCIEPGCALSSMGVTIKSVEVDTVDGS
ncbi:hypothetical protein [Desulforhopalus singaporensis]|uniref:Ogr/Delta-like zinc finger n=1 Tax=Desulforhopalus singaporensis TaxID=91360 RepID=A0A1H0W308_9BACT|nr:hypothetical protein [Desulforhopalus singaporensis]SDP85099.1 hypothetical protein SAMN05660330_04395 [Desulforhopalus singaporensis]